jgi:hypothetical protein
MMAADRCAFLTPEYIADYDVDGFDPFSQLTADAKRGIWVQHIEQFVSKHKRPRPIGLPPQKVKNALVTKGHFDTTVDITIGNLAPYLSDKFAFCYIPSSQLTKDNIAVADVVIFHRTMDRHTSEMMKIAKSTGKRCFYLMDDDLLSIHELGGDFAVLAPETETHHAIVHQLTDADGVITYSDIIQRSALEHNSNAAKLSTNIEAARIPSKRSPVRDRFKLAFAGGAGRKDEMAMLSAAVRNIADKYRDRVEFHFWGYCPEDLKKKRLRSPLFVEPFTFSYNEYLGRLSRAGFNALLTPLYTEKAAKAAKSPIKFLEATAAGAIGVFSDVEPYKVVENGVSGIKCLNTVESWTAAIESAISMSSDAADRMFMAAREKVIGQFSSEAQAKLLYDVLEGAMSIETHGYFLMCSGCIYPSFCPHAGRCLAAAQSGRVTA